MCDRQRVNDVNTMRCTLTDLALSDMRADDKMRRTCENDGGGGAKQREAMHKMSEMLLFLMLLEIASISLVRAEFSIVSKFV